MAKWLSNQLREREDIPAISSSAAALPRRFLQPDDVLIAISQSGETAPVINVVDSHDGVTTIGVTQPDSTLSQRTDHTIPLPSFGESEKIGPYATKSTIGQIAVLQVALFDYTADMNTLNARFKALDGFIHEHLSSQEFMGIKHDSHIAEAITAIDAKNDLHSSPVFAHTVHQSGIGAEMALKFSEFAHVQSDALHIADVRDQTLNLLADNKAYLVGIVPEINNPKTWSQAVYGDGESIKGQLQAETNEASLPIVAFSFGRADIDDDIRNVSRYGRRGLIPIEAYPPDSDSRTLIYFAAVQLLAFGVLSELWGRADSDLDAQTVKSVYARDLIKWEDL